MIRVCEPLVIIRFIPTPLGPAVFWGAGATRNTLHDTRILSAMICYTTLIICVFLLKYCIYYNTVVHGFFISLIYGICSYI